MTEVFIRLPKVEKMTGMKKTTIYREIAKGEFPKQFPLTSGGSVGWAESEVVKWQQERKTNCFTRRKPIVRKAAIKPKTTNDNLVLSNNLVPENLNTIGR